MFLFVLTDAILLKLDLQKRTSVLGNPPNEKLFVYKKWSTYQKIGDVLFFSYIKATIGQCDVEGDLKKSGLTQKYAKSKKSTISFQSG